MRTRDAGVAPTWKDSEVIAKLPRGGLSDTNNPRMDISTLRNKLQQINQSQVLRFWDQLPETGRQKLLAQLSELNLEQIPELVENYVINKPPVPLPKRIEPPKVYPRVPGAQQQKLYADARKRGDQLLRQGKVAAFLVAGGQ